MHRRRLRQIRIRSTLRCSTRAGLLVKVSAAHQRANLAVGNAALQHPEAAVGMDIFDPARAQDLVGLLDRPSDRFSGFNLRALDVDHAEPKSDLWAKVFEYLQLLGRA